MYDILIKNGLIVDGSGKPAFYGDLAVKDGKIAKIAPSIQESADEVIDASGLQVARFYRQPQPQRQLGVHRQRQL